VAARLHLISGASLNRSRAERQVRAIERGIRPHMWWRRFKRAVLLPLLLLMSAAGFVLGVMAVVRGLEWMLG
jgi:hypothetical protein